MHSDLSKVLKLYSTRRQQVRVISTIRNYALRPGPRMSEYEQELGQGLLIDII